MSYAFKKQVAANIRRLRIERGLSQGALARKTGLNRTFLSGVETGARNLTLETMCWIAEGMDVNVRDLFSAETANGGPSQMLNGLSAFVKRPERRKNKMGIPGGERLAS